jgi:hypothetical protein
MRIVFSGGQRWFRFFGTSGQSPSPGSEALNVRGAQVGFWRAGIRALLFADGEDAVDYVSEFVRRQQAALFDAFVLYLAEHLGHGFIVRTLDSQLFEVVSDRNFAAFLSEYDFAAASREQRMCSEHGERLFDDEIHADAGFAGKIPIAEDGLVDGRVEAADPAD